MTIGGCFLDSKMGRKVASRTELPASSLEESQKHARQGQSGQAEGDPRLLP